MVPFRTDSGIAYLRALHVLGSHPPFIFSSAPHLDVSLCSMCLIASILPLARSQQTSGASKDVRSSLHKCGPKWHADINWQPRRGRRAFHLRMCHFNERKNQWDGIKWIESRAITWPLPLQKRNSEKENSKWHDKIEKAETALLSSPLQTCKSLNLRP